MFSIGITDMKGIQDQIEITFGDRTFAVNPGLKSSDITGSGVSAAIPLTSGFTSSSFSFKVDLNGSENLHFIPAGEETCVELSSLWPSPSFNGAFLPSERKVSDKGFTASWRFFI